MKERLGLTEIRKHANRMTFAEVSRPLSVFVFKFHRLTQQLWILNFVFLPVRLKTMLIRRIWASVSVSWESLAAAGSDKLRSTTPPRPEYPNPYRYACIL